MEVVGASLVLTGIDFCERNTIGNSSLGKMPARTPLTEYPISFLSPSASPMSAGSSISQHSDTASVWDRFSNVSE